MKQSKKQRITLNHILGSIIGICSVFFFIVQKNLIIQYLKVFHITVNTRLVNIAAGIFAIFLFVSILKKFMKKTIGLVQYFLTAIIVSIFATIAVIFGIGIINNILISHTDFIEKINTPEGGVILSIAVNGIFILLIAVFVLCFSSILKPKISYLKFISEEVGRITEKEFGFTIPVKGEDELGKLSREINRMSITLKEKQENERAEEERKNQFITDISHDLRTPLTSIIGYIDLIKENGFESKEKFEQYMNVVDRRLLNLKFMIDQLFEYTKLSQKDFSLTKEKTDFMPLLSYIDFEYGRIFRKLGFRWAIHIEESPFEKGQSIFVNIESQTFLRAVGNLLENAKKYSTPNTEITMEIKRKENFVMLALSNDTNVITEQDVDQLFERFYKGDKSRSSSISTGLGLPIVKKIIELQKGEIHTAWKDNRITFIITLPLLEEER